MFIMNEGRKSQVILPDERRLDILIQPKLTAKEFLDLVASHFKLREKEYFGIYFHDDTGHNNWLHLDKRVLEHDFSRKCGSLTFFFAVRFYVESISSLRDVSTVELFYLNAKQAVFNSLIEADSETVFELAAHVLQATYGDYVDENTTREDLRKLPVIPTSALKEHPSIAYCEERVISYYKKLAESSRGCAIVNYMSIVEQLPTYGIHYYEVKDKKDIPWWLGVSHKGISVYDKADKTTPRKIFNWKQLENLYYRDKKFSIEVHDPKRVVHTLSSFNLYEDAIREPLDELDDLSDAISDPTTQVSVSRRTFGPGNIVVHAWFGQTPQLTKCIWSMAVVQHQFYLDRKHSKANLPNVRSVSELASELSRSSTSLQGSLGSDGVSQSGSSSSLPSLTASRFDCVKFFIAMDDDDKTVNYQDQIDANKIQREMYQALKARRDALEDALRKKTEELKLLCIKEGELTGILPKETPLAPGEQAPQIRRRVGTAFSLANKVQPSDENKSDAVAKLELEYELQKQITNAALKLSTDKAVSKYVRKQRRQSFQKAQAKLKEMEKKLQETRQQSESAKRIEAPSYDGIRVSPTKSPDVQRHKSYNYNGSDGQFPPMMQRSATARELSPTSPLSPSLSPTLSSPQLGQGDGYHNRYKKQTYSPVLPQRTHSSGSSVSNQSEYENVRTGNGGYEIHGSQDSGFCSANNYNISTQRTSFYNSAEEIKTPVAKEPDKNSEIQYDKQNRFYQQSKHGSLDGSYRKSMASNYGSLERVSKKGPDQYNTQSSTCSGVPNSESDSSIVLSNLEPSKYGSKRSSQTENDTDDDTSSKNLIEVPVHHKDSKVTPYKQESSRPLRDKWSDTARTEPSPVIKSPQAEHSDTTSQCYSPRIHEGSFFEKGKSNTPSIDESNITRRREKRTITSKYPPANVSTVISKPFEMSDFFKYSEKIRRQRMIEQYQQQLIGSSRCSSPSQQSSDSGEMPSPGSLYFHYQNQSKPPSSGSGSPRSGMRSGPSSTYSSRQTSPYLGHKRMDGKFEQSSLYPSSVSPKFVKEQSTHVQYSVQTSSGSRVYKSVQKTTHTQYKPLTPLKCDPINSSSSSTPTSSSPSTVQSRNSPSRQPSVPYSGHPQGYYHGSPVRHLSHGAYKQPTDVCDMSFSQFEPKDNVAEDFSEEMMAWYDDTGNKKPSYV